ncbi:hypothetical protein [Deefgea rivuli]|uniref:hypothetical protein n=1 Tax=Deefgea rivuli TaxID=400948 RepID=UPI0012EB1E61|nr:hypothetical protein [Deefgea rivuli]
MSEVLLVLDFFVVFLVMLRFGVNAVPRSLSWGLKSRPSAPSEERDKQFYRLAHDRSRAQRSWARPGRLSLLTFFGEAKKVSPRRGLRL